MINLNSKSLFSFRASVKQTNNECPTFAKLINISGTAAVRVTETIRALSIMSSDDIKALLTLFITASLLYVFGFFCLLRPEKVRTFFFRQMDFFHRKRLVPSYQSRKQVMSHSGFLVYLKIVGVVILLTASLTLFLFIYKLTELGK